MRQYNKTVSHRISIFLLIALCVIAAATLVQAYLPQFQLASVAISQDTIEPTAISTAHIGQIIDNRPASPFPEVPEETIEPENKPVTQNVSASITATPVPISEAVMNVEAVNTAARAAVVNIVCFPPHADGPISGSGVVIDPRGVILTNAHIAQYFLLRDSGRIALTCTIRTGSPAVNAYTAEVLYVSTQWITQHAHQITEERATGTGENDFALLRITGTTSGAPLPSSFEYIAPDTASAAAYAGQEVVIVSYPAGFLGSVARTKDLTLSSTATDIKQVFTFGSGTHDIASLGGVIVAQTGSSGGAVVNAAKRLIALIATSSMGGATADRDLHAITLHHISVSLEIETGQSLARFLSGNLNALQAIFEQNAKPALEEALLSALSNR